MDLWDFSGTLWRTFEVMGTLAFAASGAFTGVRKGFDIFGVVVLGLITAVGGGITRDVLSGNLPPLAIRYPGYCVLAIATSLAVFGRPIPVLKADRTVAVLDAIGLGAFAAGGSMMAVNMGFQSTFTVVALGVITAVGGGILRDVLSGTPPLIFRREVYASAAILGSLVFIPARSIMGDHWAMYVCMGVTTLCRLMGIFMDLHLPSGRPKRS
ncbi:trimeric intracellular cation channel family protein [Thermanaerovibrio acidaminovorans]|jgi:uncharacterized membrane protein YeiH|uniref:trimeric intracellular cation channel family protein n=1 Tax=Thermanaerovibrio acidaminovorans TaxID=81462 RepID=UPI002493AD83|nr:trimeric intracellular cation channel family protein [Thermanaerovibrio acidaminovorans]